MRKRIAIIVGSAGAATVLAVGLAAAGFGPVPGASAGTADGAEPAIAQAAVEALLAPWDGSDAALAPVVQVEEEVVYIRPAATPKTIRVTRVAAAPARSAADDDGGRRVRADDDDDDDDDAREDRREEREDEREDEREEREDRREEREDD